MASRVVLPSPLGFAFRNTPPLRDSLRIAGESRSSFAKTWTQPWGELTKIRDQHNELPVDVSEGSAPKRHFIFGLAHGSAAGGDRQARGDVEVAAETAMAAGGGQAIRIRAR